MMPLVLTLPLLFASAEVPRLEDAGQQLAYARAKKQELRGLEGAERERARDAAIDAYRSVREHHPRARAAVAEAAFRAGELLRAAGRCDEARLEFRVAAHEGAESGFRVRARLELGHLARRAEAPEEALAEYLAALADAEACGHERDEALFWTGRVHASQGRAEDARRAWHQVAEEALDPVDRVRAYDELGLLWLQRGDAEAAAGEWNRCRAALADDASEETETGERVRGALAGMRTLRLLRETARRRAQPPPEPAPEKPRERDRDA
jgi:tetratricopeptide (TPR) repeat protein